MKIAIIYDWLDTKIGGAEEVLWDLHCAFPEADLYVAYMTENAPEWIKKLTVKTSSMQKKIGWWRWKFIATKFLPTAFEEFDLSKYEVIISVSSFAAKSVLTNTNQIHIGYILTPPRWLYDLTASYLGEKWEKWPFIGIIIKKYLQKIRRFDQISAYRPDFLIPISKLVGQRIVNNYGRNFEKVIYPPINVQKWQELMVNGVVTAEFEKFLDKCPANFNLVVARQVKYKKIAVAIEASLEVEWPLVVIGNGPEKKNLKKIAERGEKRLGKKLIYFYDNASDEEVAKLYLRADNLIMVGQEDFGITAMEAKFFGLRTIINVNSGAGELLDQDKNEAIFLQDEKVKTLVLALNNIKNIDKSLKIPKNDNLGVEIFKNRLKYSSDEFIKSWQKLVNDLWTQKKGKNVAKR